MGYKYYLDAGGPFEGDRHFQYKTLIVVGYVLKANNDFVLVQQLTVEQKGNLGLLVLGSMTIYVVKDNGPKVENPLPIGTQVLMLPSSLHELPSSSISKSDLYIVQEKNIVAYVLEEMI